ncbi:MAG: Ppx/GppA phosphatase family protein [Mycobacteriales bacterium]
MSRVAAIDCGTNSLRLLVADVDPAGGTLVDVVRRMEVVRLGYGVDRTGRLDPAALERTLRMLGSYAEQVQGLAVDRVRMCATSATRDAANRDEFVAGVRAVLGVEPEVVTGEEEAALSFAGATRELLVERALDPPYLVVDIGGGSTEFVLGSASVAASRSVDIGCVRLTERHLADDPPTQRQLAAAVADIDRALTLVRTALPVGQASTLVGLAGSVTTVAALALDLPAYDAQRIHHARIPAAEVHAVTERLVAMTRAERAALPVMHEGRVDVIAAGALVLDTILARFGFDAVVASEHDILDGIAWSLVGVTDGD